LSVTRIDPAMLQRTLGNRAVARLLGGGPPHPTSDRAARPAIQRTIRAQDAAPPDKDKLLAGHAPLAALDHAPEPYLFQSWGDVQILANTHDPPSDIHILSPKYHLIGEAHSERSTADFISAVKAWGWGAHHFSEAFSTSTTLPNYSQETNPRSSPL
jgi:hypothetical protein